MVAAPDDKRDVHVKIWTASAALAAASGPVVGGLLVEASWRWIFLLNIPVGVIAIAVAIRFVPDVAREAGARLPDLLGGLLLVLSPALHRPPIRATIPIASAWRAVCAVSSFSINAGFSSPQMRSDCIR
jgi:MFS family permease